MIRRLRGIRRRLLLWSNRARFFLRLRRRGWLVQLTLPERYRRVVRWSEYGLTGFSLLSAFIVFGTAWHAFLVGILVFGATKLVEKATFSYSSMYVAPFPTFDLEPGKWLGGIFGLARQPGNPHEIPVAGMLVQDEEYARKIHALLLAWSCGNLRDDDRNVCVSAILLGTSYVMYLYPSISREPARRFFQSVERDRGVTSPDELHNELFVLFILGKRFTMEHGSYLPTFRNRYQDGVPYLFHVMIPGAGGKPADVPGLPPLVLFTLKVKERGQLTRADVEYDLMSAQDDD